MSLAGGEASAAGRDFPDLRVVSGSLGAASWVVSTRHGGVSGGHFAESNLANHLEDDSRSVEANRRAFAGALGCPQGLAFIRAEHGSRIASVCDPEDVAEVDAITTTRLGLGLVALGADCAVIGLVGLSADQPPIIAAVHCGWRGLVSDVVGVAVSSIVGQGYSTIRAIVGPAICGRCYRVPDERLANVRSECSAAVVAAAISNDDPVGGLDVGAGVQARLSELGVEHDAPFGCTYEDDEWFSFRRASADPVAQGRTGRHGLGIVIA